MTGVRQSAFLNARTTCGSATNPLGISIITAITDTDLFLWSKYILIFYSFFATNMYIR